MASPRLAGDKPDAEPMRQQPIRDRGDVGDKLVSPPTDHDEPVKLLDVPKLATVAVSDGLNFKKLVVSRKKHHSKEAECSCGNGASYNNQNEGERLPPEKTQNPTLDKSNAYIGKPLRKSCKRTHSQINEEGEVVKTEKVYQTRPRRAPLRKNSHMKSLEPQKSESKQQKRRTICEKSPARKILKPNVKSSTKGSVGKVTNMESSDHRSKIEILTGKLIKEDDLSGEQVSEAENRKKELDGSLVGFRIKIWWPIDVTYYPGVVKSFDAVTKKHMIHYVDGDKEDLLLNDECWKLLENNTKPSRVTKKKVKAVHMHP